MDYFPYGYYADCQWVTSPFQDNRGFAYPPDSQNQSFYTTPALSLQPAIFPNYSFGPQTYSAITDSPPKKSKRSRQSKAAHEARRISRRHQEALTWVRKAEKGDFSNPPTDANGIKYVQTYHDDLWRYIEDEVRAKAGKENTASTFTTSMAQKPKTPNLPVEKQGVCPSCHTSYHVNHGAIITPCCKVVMGNSCYTRSITNTGVGWCCLRKGVSTSPQTAYQPAQGVSPTCYHQPTFNVQTTPYFPMNAPYFSRPVIPPSSSVSSFYSASTQNPWLQMQLPPTRQSHQTVSASASQSNQPINLRAEIMPRSQDFQQPMFDTSNAGSLYTAVCGDCMPYQPFLNHVSLPTGPNAYSSSDTGTVDHRKNPEKRGHSKDDSFATLWNDIRRFHI